MLLLLLLLPAAERVAVGADKDCIPDDVAVMAPAPAPTEILDDPAAV
jgi:hypothetical protein